jgi:uncharacterized membrane protein YgdD (TMEM256/DUF423 family)
MIGAVLGGLGVCIGAFGAHALQDRLSEYSLGIFETAVQYHFYHALALIAYGLFSERHEATAPSWPAVAFISGVIVFSGSLYALALTDIKILGAITPIGGLAFIVGWVGFAVAAAKGPSDQSSAGSGQ